MHLCHGTPGISLPCSFPALRGCSFRVAQTAMLLLASKAIRTPYILCIALNYIPKVNCTQEIKTCNSFLLDTTSSERLFCVFVVKQASLVMIIFVTGRVGFSFCVEGPTITVSPALLG